MQAKIICPRCNSESTMFLVKTSYKGPYRCWKCRQLFTIKLKNGELKSCEPLAQEEFDKQQQAKVAKAKRRKKAPQN